MTELIICAVCNKPYVSNHGNYKYHPMCGDIQHILNSRKRYAFHSSLNNPRWKSRKVLKDALRRYGTGFEVDPVELLYDGLDFNLEFMYFEYKGIIIFFLEKVGFSVNNNKTIQLWTL